MKTLLFSIGFLFIVACGNPQTNSEPSPLLAEGNMTLQELREQSWYAASYEPYNPDEDLVNELAENLDDHDYDIDVYFGTWCGDSKREVPKLVKLLEKTEFDLSRLTLVAVDESKEVPDVSPEIAEQLNIMNVPTIIFYEKGKETERFVEYAQESLLEDLIKIASGEEYVDSYEW